MSLYILHLLDFDAVLCVISIVITAAAVFTIGLTVLLSLVIRGQARSFHWVNEAGSLDTTYVLYVVSSAALKSTVKCGSFYGLITAEDYTK